MGGSSAGAGSSTGGSGGPPKQNVVQRVISTAIKYSPTLAVARAVGRGIKSANKKSQQNLMDYEGQAAGVTPMRGPNNMNNDSGNDTAPTQVATNVGGKIIKSPTTAEVSQSSATDAAAYDNRKTKAKGRSMTIMTSSRGINRNNTLTLGKPSLLGR
jgi:hypothetical protein